MTDATNAPAAPLPADALLGAHEPAPVHAERGNGASDFVVVVDHAGRRIPQALNGLGLPDAELSRHIGWDIGALEVAIRVAEQLDAPLLAQRYSRLVIDCNRKPTSPTSVPLISETTEIPGNRQLSGAEIDRRRREIFEPYHAAIGELLARRRAAGRRTILVAQHTMTDVYRGVARPMHAAVLYNRDRRFAGPVLDALRAIEGLVVAENEPYFLSDDTDYTIPHHAEARGLLHVEIEIRQDLVGDAAGQALWADRVVRALRSAHAACREA